MSISFQQSTKYTELCPCFFKCLLPVKTSNVLTAWNSLPYKSAGFPVMWGFMWLPRHVQQLAYNVVVFSGFCHSRKPCISGRNVQLFVIFFVTTVTCFPMIFLDHTILTMWICDRTQVGRGALENSHIVGCIVSCFNNKIACQKLIKQFLIMVKSHGQAHWSILSTWVKMVWMPTLWSRERLFTYFLCSLIMSVNEQHKAIWRTGFDVSTLSAADCSVSPGSR